ncbi:MAG TPA: hypothetical protein VNE00_09185 [Paraburkholderia sp.]|jgi:hypothetical protein|nr:hypothetical protein [Paraburkholderia sp.]
MTIRAFTLASAAAAAVALCAGCTVASTYRNSNACEQQMREAASRDAAAETLKISHAGVGIDGSRVVVEGTLSHEMTPTEAAIAAKAPPPPPTRGLFGPIVDKFSAKRPKQIIKAAAVECTFGPTGLASFHWLAPDRLANPPVANSDAAAQ